MSEDIQKLNPSTQDRIARIRAKLVEAEALQPDPRPDYWDTVVSACERVIRALETGRGLKEARKAADAVAVSAADAALWWERKAPWKWAWVSSAAWAASRVAALLAQDAEAGQ